MIVDIFELVLETHSVQPQDSFFELGGDSMLCMALLAEIETRTGHALPITALQDSPTPAGIAALLDAPPSAPPAMLVRLKAGDTVAPIFIMPGLGGTIIELQQLGQRIATPGAIYAVQAQGLDGTAPALDRVEDMAARALRGIVAMQPSGPYRLLGYSFGGLVAIETARLLRAEGRAVAMLGLLDTYPHPKVWPAATRLSILLALLRASDAKALLAWALRHQGRKLAALPWRARPGHLYRLLAEARHLQRITHAFDEFARVAAGPPGTLPPGPEPGPGPLQTVRQAGLAALAHYRPSRYEGEMTFIKAQDDPRFPSDPAALWGRLAARLLVRAVPCDHRAMLKSHVDDLAAAISQVSARASA